jgi:hypothetical protein
MKLKIEIGAGSQIVECSGHPLELLMELTTFFVRQAECRHLLKSAMLLAEVGEKHVKDGKFDMKNINPDSQTYREGTKIIADFMKRYANGNEGECNCENCKPKKN